MQVATNVKQKQVEIDDCGNNEGLPDSFFGIWWWILRLRTNIRVVVILDYYLFILWPKTNFEIMRLTLILVSSFLILMGSNPSYASRVRFRRDKKRPVQQPSKGQKQTDEEYPDHGQSNLGKLLSIWSNRACVVEPGKLCFSQHVP